MLSFSKCLSAAAVSVGILFAATQSFAAPVELVTNGDFETVTGGALPAYIKNRTINGWTQVGAAGRGNYDSIYNAGGLQSGPLPLWGPASGYNNGLTNSPTGGNMVGLDGDRGINWALTQTIGGLKIGKQYELSFWWASGQQKNFNGPVTNSFQYSFGSEVKNTAVVALPQGGFEPWAQVKSIFTATSTSQLLSFLSLGTPNGQPPIALLDGVSMTEVAPVPLPAALPLLGLGLAGLFGLRRMRRKA